MIPNLMESCHFFKMATNYFELSAWYTKVKTRLACSLRSSSFTWELKCTGNRMKHQLVNHLPKM